jgi:DNA primase
LLRIVSFLIWLKSIVTQMPGSLIEEIKSRLDIVAVAKEYLDLQQVGRNWRGLCPFHQEKHPSLLIFSDSQRWKCFGAGCGSGGDVIDLVQQLQDWDFMRTLRYLGEKAGVSLPGMDAKTRQVILAQRGCQDTLAAAMSYFRENMFSSSRDRHAPAGESAGLLFAHNRGWTDEVIHAAGLGCFGKDWDRLKRHLDTAGVDLESPPAVALIGFRGDVAAWGEKFGLQPGQKWISQGRVPAMPADMLIYPHLVRGRPVYISGRALSGKGHWNPPSQLLGARQPFFNHLYWRPDPACPYIVIVEGQADAITLAQWGLPAVALLGVELSAGKET